MDLQVIEKIKTPAFIVEERLLKKNLALLAAVQAETGCKILLAQKAFSMYYTYPMMRNYLSGTTASSLFEARLGYEEFGGETHIFAPAYKEEEFDAIMKYCGHIIFNSFSQWKKYRGKVRTAEKAIGCGLRINPEYSEIETDIYNPCFPGSRMGVTLEHFEEGELDGIEGFHFHTMCEQNSDTLERTLVHAEDKFGTYFHQMKWINFGGGHHITRPDYDVDRLISCIKRIQETYQVQVYLEPGEAVGLGTGYLAAQVLDIIHNGIPIAIMDTSAACHMPDVLEMPYRPEVVGAGAADEKKFTYRLGGPTCLAGDIIGDYSFNEPLVPGDRLLFLDMAHYSMVKTNTFNGINLPDILYLRADGMIEKVKSFDYEDFKRRI